LGFGFWVLEFVILDFGFTIYDIRFGFWDLEFEIVIYYLHLLPFSFSFYLFPFVLPSIIVSLPKKIMKRIIGFCLVLGALSGYGQHKVKVNAATTLLGFPSIGYERPIGKYFSFHIDAIGSTFNRYHNMPLKFLIITPEVRYYPKATQTGFFVGGHLGGSTFHLQKYGYENTNKYQKGYNYMAGISLGYVYALSDKFALEGFVGGGTIQSYYRGYDITTGLRYEDSYPDKFNKSGEWLPYRGGVNLVWKI
jgi:hypothetical protein